MAHSNRVSKFRRLRLETLEDRLAPAVTTFAAGVLSIDMTADSEAVTVSNDGTTISISSAAGVTGGGSSFATTDITRITAVNSGERTGTLLRLSGPSAYTLSGGFSADGMARVAFATGLSVTGTSSLTAVATQRITVSSAISVVNGDLSLTANRQATPTLASGRAVVLIGGSSVTSTGAGNILLSTAFRKCQGSFGELRA
jgi:hypothetical protein